MSRTYAIHSLYSPLLTGAGVLAICALAAGCVGEIDGAARVDGITERRESCRYLTFDLDGNDDPVAAGDVLDAAYASDGVSIEVWGDAAMTIPGLPVAFDSSAPTGGDDDLAFTGQGNLLINQERFTPDEVAAGQVGVPDDNARGGFFELRFEEPVCVKSLVLLDIDFGEDPVELAFYNPAGLMVASHSVAPMGNNVRIDVPLPVSACGVTRMTVEIESSGALDDIEICGSAAPPIEREIWNRIFDGGGDDIGTDIVTNAARDVFVSGTSDVGSGTDGIVRKYDSTGLLAWTAQIDFGGNDEAHGIDVDTNGDVLVTGRGMATGDDDLYLRKLDPTTGAEIWNRTFDGGGNDVGFDVSVDRADNSIIVVGMAEVAVGTDILMRKYDSDGALMWSKSVDVGINDAAHGVFSCPGGPIAVAGQTDNGSDVDYWLTLLDADGNEQWTKIFDGGGDDIARGTTIDGSGNVLVAGEAFNGSNSDILIRKFDGDGNLLFSLPVDTGGSDGAREITTDASGSLIVTGFLAGATGRDAFTRKYAANGTEEWTEIFDRGGDDEGYGVTVDLAGSVLSTGYFEGPSDRDLWLAKYRP